MRLKVLRAFHLGGGAIAEVGSIVDIEKVMAGELLHTKKAELAQDESLPPYEPMTVTNTPALVPGKPGRKGKSHAGQ